MDRGKLFSGLFIMIGLIVLGFMFPWSVAKNRSFDRTVNVKGLCEWEVKADKVIWPSPLYSEARTCVWTVF